MKQPFGAAKAGTRFLQWIGPASAGMTGRGILPKKQEPPSSRGKCCPFLKMDPRTPSPLFREKNSLFSLFFPCAPSYRAPSSFFFPAYNFYFFIVAPFPQRIETHWLPNSPKRYPKTRIDLKRNSLIDSYHLRMSHWPEGSLGRWEPKGFDPRVDGSAPGRGGWLLDGLPSCGPRRPDRPQGGSRRRLRKTIGSPLQRPICLAP